MITWRTRGLKYIAECSFERSHRPAIINVPVSVASPRHCVEEEVRRALDKREARWFMKEARKNLVDQFSVAVLRQTEPTDWFKPAKTVPTKAHYKLEV